MNDPRGSIWRKWDLHIHTPASFHWNGGKRFSEMSAQETEAKLQEIADKIRQSDVACFAIMDYWTFDGYWILRDYLERKPQALDKAVFPGMELRIEAPVDYRLNIQVVFSDHLTKQQLQDFRGALRIGVTNRPLSDESLIDFAQQLGEDVAQRYGFSPEDLRQPAKLLQLGSKTAKITRESLQKAQAQIPGAKPLLIMPYDTSDGLMKLDWEQHPYDDAYFMQSADIFETRDLDNVALFLNQETEQNQRFIMNFLKTMGGKPKLAVSGSDAHKIADYGIFPSNKITWLKADSEFEGLLQVVKEPAGRSFIGAIPPKLALVQQKKTKYIQSVEIKRNPGATLQEVWFDNEMPLNPDLIAVIGNKGKGKSALTDTIGLLANTKQHREFTFLSPSNFRQPRENKARHFQATMTWVSGTPSSKGLDEDVDEQQPELVKYIPQNFLETICTQLGGIEETEFDRELKKVIFSHVDLPGRLGKASLDDLIQYKTMEANDKLQILRQEMHKINEEIVLLEEHSQLEHKQSIINLLKLKTAELEALDRSKPEPVTEPTNDTNRQEEIALVSRRLADAKASLAECERQVAQAATDQAKQLQLVSVVDKLASRVLNLERQLQTFVTSSEADFASIGLAISQVVKISVDQQPLIEKRQSFLTSMSLAEGLQNGLDPNSPAGRKILTEKQIEVLQSKLDEPNKRYQAYLAVVKQWQDQRVLIIGSDDVQGTIKFFEKQLIELDAIPSALLKTKADRLSKAKELHAVIRQLAGTYRDLYAPVNDFIESRPLAKDKFQLNFDVGVVDMGFEGTLFEYVSQGVAGTFCGVEDGHKRMSEILARQDFNTEQGIEAFLTEIIDSLEIDKRPGGKPVRLGSLLRTRKTPLGLYDAIFGLEYLKPRYSLRMGEKELHELSPGERGTLLLVFYLLVDKDDIPLVIDQPEENLDNQTVYDLLVPCVKEAKLRRQIFIVTHNPNLAVVCDAEQIIWADLDKKNNYTMRYTTGAIESHILNRAVVDILEGTMPAFDNRDSKYLR